MATTNWSEIEPYRTNRRWFRVAAWTFLVVAVCLVVAAELTPWNPRSVLIAARVGAVLCGIGGGLLLGLVEGTSQLLRWAASNVPCGVLPPDLPTMEPPPAPGVSRWPPGTRFWLCACKRHVPAPCDPTCPDYSTGRHPLFIE